MSWTRTPGPPTGRVADVVLVVLHRGPLADVAVGPERFGTVRAEDTAVLGHIGPEAVAWLDGFRSGALRTLAARDLVDLAALDAADACVTVRCRLPEPPDLGYLQSAWAVARWLCARGATVVVDARAMRYWSAEAALAVLPDAPFDLRRELTVVVETAPSAVLGGYVVHTRGLLKLARPDLVTVVAAEDRDAAAAALWRLAGRLAGVAVGDAEPIPLLLVPAPPGSFVEALHLDNDAVLVVGTDGGAPEWPRGGRAMIEA